jgi:hypothetical protein
VGDILIIYDSLEDVRSAMNALMSLEISELKLNSQKTELLVKEAIFNSLAQDEKLINNEIKIVCQTKYLGMQISFKRVRIIDLDLQNMGTSVKVAARKFKSFHPDAQACV